MDLDHVNSLAGECSAKIEFLEKEIGKVCHYVQHVVVGQQDSEHLFALIFPKRALFSNPDYSKTPEEGCFCPRNISELGRCVSGCIKSMNDSLPPGHARIYAVAIIDAELSVEDGTLTSASQPDRDKVFAEHRERISELLGGKSYNKPRAVNLKFT